MEPLRIASFYINKDLVQLYYNDRVNKFVTLKYDDYISFCTTQGLEKFTDTIWISKNT